MFSGAPLGIMIAVLTVWLTGLAWTFKECRTQSTSALGIGAAFVCVFLVLSIHLSWISADLSQWLGSDFLRVCSLGLTIAVPMSFFLNLPNSRDNVRPKLIGLASVVVCGVWWFMLAMSAAISMGSPTVRHPVVYQIEDGYVGWVRVDFGVAGTASLPTDAGPRVYRFPAEGKLRTSSNQEFGWAKDTYVYVKSGRTVRELSQDWENGEIWGHVFGSETTTVSLERQFERFFVGSKSQFERAAPME